jgi:hypothetical protein
MSDIIEHIAAEAAKMLHGARSLPPVHTVEALTPFLDAMGRETSKSKLADASTAAVTELVRSLKENHAASNDLWEDAIETTLSFVNQQS